jgi:uncharacterized protein YndB with AHSA1/START domain
VTEALVEKEIFIAASPDIVFELLTEPEGLLEWMAVEAETDIQPGGLVWWRHENGAVMRGRFVEVTPPRRLCFTYGWEENGPDVAAESTLVEIDLREQAGGTLLCLVHKKLPEGEVKSHGMGWDWFLGRLVAVAKGRHFEEGKT